MQETVGICPCLTTWKHSITQSMIERKNVPNYITYGPAMELSATAMEAKRSFETEAIYSWTKSLFIHK